MRRVSLLSLGSAAICKTSIAVVRVCSQDEEPQLATAACTVVIAASQATAATDLFRADAVRAAAAYDNRAWVCYSTGNSVRALQERGKPFNSGRPVQMCSIRQRTFWRFPAGAQTPFRPIEALCALIPTLKEAKKVLGDWVQRPNIQMRPAKLIWNKYSRPLAWRG
jgi:hypothetical protein